MQFFGNFRCRESNHAAMPSFARDDRNVRLLSAAAVFQIFEQCKFGDFALDFLYCCSVIMLHLSRLAEDWILYSSEEFGWLALGDGVTSGSSLMPQKKNPDSLELIRGKSGRVFGDLTSLFMTMKGLPMTYNRDMQEDKEPLFDAFHQTSGSLAMARAVAESVTLDCGRPATAAEESWLVATDLAEELARDGVPFHRAHQLAGKLVLESVKLGSVGWVSGLVNAFPNENRVLWDLAVAGRWTEARELYRWYTPLLHLDTHPKLVQYIKLAMAETGMGTETTRAPRLPIEGAERERIRKILRRALKTRPAGAKGRALVRAR